MNNALKKKDAREPLFHIVKRDQISPQKAILIRVIAVAAALLLCSLLAFFLIGANPLKFLQTIYKGAFGTPHRIWTLAKDAAILLCLSLAVTPAFRMRFWNLGADGQALVGALAAVTCAAKIADSVPSWALLLIMVFTSILAGAIWGVLPAIFKAIWGTNESLFTLMMNYVATHLVTFVLLKWLVSNGSTTLGELPFGHLPRLFKEELLVILIALLLAALMYIYLNYTKHGYEISVVGESENTARYIGINVKKVTIRTMILSGAVCGIAGFLIVSAFDHSITAETIGGLGFTAIMVSWLAKFNPIVMLLTSTLIVFLERGGAQISTSFNISSAFPSLVVGLILFFIIGCEFFINYRIKFHKGGSDQ